jgi:hypothetical protein
MKKISETRKRTQKKCAYTYLSLKWKQEPLKSEIFLKVIQPAPYKAFRVSGRVAWLHFTSNAGSPLLVHTSLFAILKRHC